MVNSNYDPEILGHYKNAARVLRNQIINEILPYTSRLAYNEGLKAYPLKLDDKVSLQLQQAFLMASTIANDLGLRAVNIEIQDCNIQKTDLGWDIDIQLQMNNKNKRIYDVSSWSGGFITLPEFKISVKPNTFEKPVSILNSVDALSAQKFTRIIAKDALVSHFNRKESLAFNAYLKDQRLYNHQYLKLDID